MKKLIIGFIFGFAAGATITVLYTKKKVDSILQSEIEDLREWRKRQEEKKTPASGSVNPISSNKKEVLKNESIVKKYTNYRTPGNAAVDIKEAEITSKIEVITSELYGEEDGYDCVTLTCYSDKIITDDSDSPIDDVDSLIGAEALYLLGRDGQDSIYVRDHRLKIDYEILYDKSPYSG